MITNQKESISNNPEISDTQASSTNTPTVPGIGNINLESLSNMAMNLMGGNNQNNSSNTPNLEALMTNPEVQKMMGNFMNLFKGGSNTSL